MCVKIGDSSGINSFIIELDKSNTSVELLDFKLLMASMVSVILISWKKNELDLIGMK